MIENMCQAEFCVLIVFLTENKAPVGVVRGLFVFYFIGLYVSLSVRPLGPPWCYLGLLRLLGLTLNAQMPPCLWGSDEVDLATCQDPSVPSPETSFGSD